MCVGSVPITREQSLRSFTPDNLLVEPDLSLYDWGGVGMKPGEILLYDNGSY